MTDSSGDLPGDHLTLDEYIDDYSRRYEETHHSKSWKFERRQTFREPDDDSWIVFDQGDWERALEIFEERRAKLLEDAKEDQERGIELYRVRVVTEPISPYLLWELNALQVRSECGENIRIIDPRLIDKWEHDGELPEILTLGANTVYQVLYNEEGEVRGAIRSIDRSAVTWWTTFIEKLYEKGEEISSFFTRKVAGRKPLSRA